MNALVVPKYGAPDVVEVRSLPEPSPRRGEIVVRVAATTVNSGDARLRSADFPPGMALLGRLMFGWTGPRSPVLGAELAGVVERVGPGVTTFAVGDRVLAMTGFRMGAHAERCVIAADHCTVRLPDTVPFDVAVTLPFGGTTALTYLRDKARLQSSERILVIGASGAVGAACVQVARLLGARVTGVCSGRNADLVRTLGAERVIDYTTTDPFATDEHWDVVIDTVGRATARQCRALATPTGRIGLVASGLPTLLLAPWVNLTSRQRVLVGPADESPAHVAQLVEWLEQGSWKPVIDGRFGMADAAEAYARVDSQRKVGSVVLTLEGGASVLRDDVVTGAQDAGS
ncbi:MAG: NAD(P)-dependent alcohol dehydrogenase [Myxococcota bacterium]